MRSASLPRAPEVESWAADCLAQAVAQGATQADLLFTAGAGTSLVLRDGEEEERSRGVSCGVGLRTILGDGRQGVAFINGFDPAMRSCLVPWSLANARDSTADEAVGLYEGPLGACDALEMEDPTLEALSPADRFARAAEITDRARGEDPRVVSVRAASWYDGWGKLFYASSAGLFGWQRSTSVGCALSVVLQEGDAFEMGGAGEHARFVADLSLEKMAREGVRRTALSLGGEPVPTGYYPLVLDPESAASLVDEVAELFLGSNVQKGKSLFRGRLGEEVGEAVLSLVDDGRLPRRDGSAPFDGEGFPTGRTLLLDRGRVNAFLYDLATARREGGRSTGNAVRGISSAPDVGASNVFILPGNEAPEAIRRQRDPALLVTEFMGLHTLDPVSGEFSLGAKGVVLRSGLPAEPFAGVTVAGNLTDLLRGIVAVGNDLRFFGSTGGCTLLVDRVAVAGR